MDIKLLGILACMGVAIVAAFGLGYSMAAHHYEPIVSGALTHLGEVTQANQSLELMIDRQNEAVDTLKKASDAREKSSLVAFVAARAKAKPLQQAAQVILHEPAPSADDACTAASKAFDDALRAERGKWMDSTHPVEAKP
jgi:hypothetical protein